MGKEKRMAGLYMQRPWRKEKQTSGNKKAEKNACLAWAQGAGLSWWSEQRFLHHTKILAFCLRVMEAT